MKRLKRRVLAGKALLSLFLFIMAAVCLVGFGKTVDWLVGAEKEEQLVDFSMKLMENVDKNSYENEELLITSKEGAKEHEAVAAFASKHSLSLAAWPGELLELLEKNPEAEEFVLNYPLKKDMSFDIDLTEYETCDTVPLFLQWDERWGYTRYGSNVMGLTGCGPTCLSMVCMYLLKDASYTPRYIAEFAEENNYYVEGSGSAWTLISKGGETLGLDVVEISLDENRMMKNLELGNPIICILGPGDFTTTGHFIVLTGCKDGKFVVNDPNSRINSERLWSFEEIKGQIKNLWVCRLPERKKG